MFETTRFSPYMHEFIIQSAQRNINFDHNCIYLINSQQGNIEFADLFFVKNEDNILRNELGDVWGLIGMHIQSSISHVILEGGVMRSDVILNYTRYIEMECASLRIQRTWRKRRMIRAVERISNAFQLWQIRKNELWNPNCFVGIAHLVIEINRAFENDKV